MDVDANDLVNATRGQLAQAQAAAAEYQAAFAGAERRLKEKDMIIDALTADRAAIQKMLAEAKALLPPEAAVKFSTIPVEPASG